jgi:hypothetical protein
MPETDHESDYASQPNAQSQPGSLGTPILPVPPQESPAGNTQTDNRQSQPVDTRDMARGLHWLEKLNIFGQIGLVILGVFAIFIYGQQLIAMRKANDITRESLTSVQRAFVHMDGFIITPVVTLQDRKHYSEFLFQGQIRNSGATQAIASRYRTNFLVSDTPLADSFMYLDRDEKGNLVAEDKGTAGFFAPQSASLANPLHIGLSNILAVQKGKHLYLYGWIRYRDVFKDTAPHLTLFCDEILFDAAPISPSNPMHPPRYVPCSKHNCTDDQCAVQ